MSRSSTAQQTDPTPTAHAVQGKTLVWHCEVATSTDPNQNSCVHMSPSPQHLLASAPANCTLCGPHAHTCGCEKSLSITMPSTRRVSSMVPPTLPSTCDSVLTKAVEG